MGTLVITPNKLLHMHGKNTAQQESYQQSSLLLLGVKLIQLEEACGVVLLACLYLYASAGV